MNAFSKRYFVWISLIFIAFSILSFFLNSFEIFVIFLAILGTIYLIFRKFGRKKRNFYLIFILAICAALAGIVNTQVLLNGNERRVEKYAGEHTVSGFVVAVSANEDYRSEMVVKIESIDGEGAAIDVVLVADYRIELSRGDFFECNATLLPLNEYDGFTHLHNKNQYDYPLLCKIGEDEEIEYLTREWRLRPMLADLNSRLSAVIKANMTKKSGSLASALLLGNRELLSDDTLRDFKRAGVYHMLALSGMHVAILVGILDYILKKLLVPMKIRIVMLGALSFFYIALTGFLLSACRAMLMTWVMYLSFLLGKRRDALTSLFTAAFVICALSPAAMLDVGLQLSVLSTFGIISATMIRAKLKLFQKSVGGKKIKICMISVLRELLFSLIASLCVFVCTLPVVMIYFGEVSLATFFTNLFMGVVCECFMILSIITLCFSKIRVLCFAFAALADIVGSIMIALVSWVSDIEGVMLSLEYPGTEILVFALFFSSLMLFAFKVRRKWLISLPCVVFAVLFSFNVLVYINTRKESVSAEFLIGDKLVLSSADEVYICDASNGRYGGFYDSVLLAKENCFTEIDGIVLTHYHSYHAISLERLVKNFKIHSVLLPMPQTYDEGLIMRTIIRVLEDQGVSVYIYEANEKLDILDGKLVVSDRAYIAGITHPSVALSFAKNEKRITVIERPYFSSYLEKSGVFDEYIFESDYLIFGSDGRAPKENFDIFLNLKPECEVSFTDFDLLNMSDFEAYLDKMNIYFGVEYKKYDLK